jgi:hypothetical protein
MNLPNQIIRGNPLHPLANNKAKLVTPNWCPSSQNYFTFQMSDLVIKDNDTLGIGGKN